MTSETPKKTRRQLSVWLQLLLCAGIVAAGYGAWQEQDAVRGWLGMAAEGTSKKRGRSRSGVPIIVAAVGLDLDTLSFEAVGTGLAQQSVVLRSKVSGTIAVSFLAAGKRFAKGDVILEFEDSEQQLSLRLAETRLKDAERIRDRLESLRKSGTVTTSSYEATITAAELARLELERAKEAVKDRIVYAPFDGITGLPMVEPGDRVEAGAELATFDDRQSLMVEFELPETLLPRINAEMGVKATTPIGPGILFDGRIISIDSRINPTSRSARIRVMIPNEQDLLRPGASFTIKLELPGGQYPTVPELALQFTSGSLYVWRIAEGKAQQVEVKLARRRAGEVLIEGDLSKGDLVVIEGTQRLRPGRTVNIIGGGTSAVPTS